MTVLAIVATSLGRSVSLERRNGSTIRAKIGTPEHGRGGSPKAPELPR